VHSRATTNKTYITKLESQLAAEREARLRLEKEIEEMKRINAEISSKLGISTGGDAAKWREMETSKWSYLYAKEIWLNYYV